MKKHIFVAVLLVATVIFSIVPISHAAPSATLYETIKSGVPVWTTASSNSKQVRKLDNGSLVTIVETVTNKAGNPWGKTVNNTWIYMGNLKKSSKSLPATGVYMTNKADVPLRKVASAGGKINKRLNKGAEVKVESTFYNDCGNPWANTSDGYVIFMGNLAEYERAHFPMQYLRITQGVYGSYSHKGVKAMDLGGKDTRIDDAFAPFTGVVKKIYPSGNTVWLESVNKVWYADGTLDYMTVMFTHDNDVSDLYVGKVIPKGTIFYQEGTKGNATGNHIHLECGRGKFTGTGWYKNSQGKWTINNSILPYDAFSLQDSTIVLDGKGYPWRK